MVSSDSHERTTMDEEVLRTDFLLALMNGKEYSTRAFSRSATEPDVMQFDFMMQRRYGDVKRGCYSLYQRLRV